MLHKGGPATEGAPKKKADTGYEQEEERHKPMWGQLDRGLSVKPDIYWGP